MNTSGRALLKKLGIKPARTALSKDDMAELEVAGYDFQEIIQREGTSSERLHDAVFLTPSIARRLLAADHVRLSTSADACAALVEQLGANSITDLGGGCGLLCFTAAQRFSDRKFIIVDQSQRALEMGEKWAGELGLKNVSFIRFSFTAKNPSECIGEEQDLALLVHVLDMNVDMEAPEVAGPKRVDEFAPALTTAAHILKRGGALYVRFGCFTPPGILALACAAFRSGLSYDSADCSAHGHSIIFRKTPPAEGLSEGDAVHDARDRFRAVYEG